MLTCLVLLKITFTPLTITMKKNWDYVVYHTLFKADPRKIYNPKIITNLGQESMTFAYEATGFYFITSAIFLDRSSFSLVFPLFPFLMLPFV